MYPIRHSTNSSTMTENDMKCYIFIFALLARMNSQFVFMNEEDSSTREADFQSCNLDKGLFISHYVIKHNLKKIYFYDSMM